jgi:hypothetical protein
MMQERMICGPYKIRGSLFNIKIPQDAPVYAYEDG